MIYNRKVSTCLFPTSKTGEKGLQKKTVLHIIQNATLNFILETARKSKN